MYKNKTFLAIIPARGGSKRLPRKNILEIGGKPLIVWSIEAALKSKHLDNTIVTSDDDEILNISNVYGSDVIKRPSELADDTSTTFDALEHVLKNTKNYDYVVLLQPTSPLRNSKHIDEAIETLMEKKADAIISVCDMEHSPAWSNMLNDDGDMSNFISEELKNKRSQDLEKYYRVNGAIYICKTDRLLDEKIFFIKDNVFAYFMDRKYSIDIDEEIDFIVAEKLLDEQQNNVFI